MRQLLLLSLLFASPLALGQHREPHQAFLLKFEKALTIVERLNQISDLLDKFNKRYCDEVPTYISYITTDLAFFTSEFEKSNLSGAEYEYLRGQNALNDNSGLDTEFMVKAFQFLRKNNQWPISPWEQKNIATYRRLREIYQQAMKDAAHIEQTIKKYYEEVDTLTPSLENKLKDFFVKSKSILDQFIESDLSVIQMAERIHEANQEIGYTFQMLFEGVDGYEAGFTVLFNVVHDGYSYRDAFRLQSSKLKTLITGINLVLAKQRCEAILSGFKK